MAASMRLRLYFEGNVCTKISPRKCWFLVKTDMCNVVADLEYLIRERFELDKALKMNLYVDDFLLPPVEKIHVVRDNDTIRIQLIEIEDDFEDCKSLSPTLSESKHCEEENLPHRQERTKKQVSKRKSGATDLDEVPKSKHSKRSRSQVTSQDADTGICSSTECAIDKDLRTEDRGKKRRNKSNKKRTEHHHAEIGVLDVPPPQPKDASNIDGENAKRTKTSDGIGEINSKQKKSTSDSLSKTPSPKRKKAKKTKKISNNRLCASETVEPKETVTQGDVCNPLNNVGRKKKDKRAIEISSQSLAVASSVKGTVPAPNAEEPPKIVATNPAQISTQKGSRQALPVDRASTRVSRATGHIRFDSSDSESGSNSESETTRKGEMDKDQTINEQTNLAPVAASIRETVESTYQQLNQNLTIEKRGPALTEITGSDQTLPMIHLPNNNNQKNSPLLTTSNGGRKSDKQNQGNWDKQSQLNATQTNKSFIVQNPPPEAEVPPKDFTSFPALLGPPRRGDVIAYKILELSESYCPELSNYKEGKVTSVDPATGQVEIELTPATMATKPTMIQGKFDLCWENGDGDNNGKEGHSEDPMVSVQLRDLVDARLLPLTSE